MTCPQTHNAVPTDNRTLILQGVRRYVADMPKPDPMDLLLIFALLLFAYTVVLAFS